MALQSCFGAEPPKLYSLFGIMNLFEASRLQDAIDELRDVACSAEWLNEQYTGSRDMNDPEFTKRALVAVQNAIEIAKRHDFTDAMQTAHRARNRLGYQCEYASVRSEVTHVADSICDELRKRNFFVVTPQRRDYVENPSFLGTDVSEAFPSAQNDIYEAGNCLGAECNTAAVFHLMRVVEWGLRALCVHMGLRNAKRAKRKHIPIAYVDWESMLNQLQPLVDAKIEKMKRGRAKQAAQEFYYPVLQDIRGIRDAWRNHLMHTRATYSSADAETICGHVKRLMSTLAKKVREQ